jgi:hypothetical protein
MGAIDHMEIEEGVIKEGAIDNDIVMGDAPVKDELDGGGFNDVDIRLDGCFGEDILTETTAIKNRAVVTARRGIIGLWCGKS